MPFDKPAYDRAYRAVNRERERPRRRAFDNTPRRYVRRIAQSTARYRAGLLARLREELNAS